MNNIFNFTAEFICRYSLIADNVESVLGHLLFAVGNGYRVNSETGMITNGRIDINQWPEFDNTRFQQVLEEVKTEEMTYIDHLREIDSRHGFQQDYDEILQEHISGAKKLELTDVDFTEDSLYRDISTTARRYKDGGLEPFYRPYPISERYSGIYQLNEHTPTWFLDIAVSLCRAWHRFLTECLNNNDVWVAPDSTQQNSADLKSIMDELIEDNRQTDAAIAQAEYTAREPRRNYADREYTEWYRDHMQKLITRLEQFKNV